MEGGLQNKILPIKEHEKECMYWVGQKVHSGFSVRCYIYN